MKKIKQRRNKVLCIIPARGGSKRIPKKNIVDFFGKPLIAYTIDAAVQSKLFENNIFISSDSQEILDIADSYENVQKIVRPKDISGDNASLEDAAIHLLESVSEKFDYLCLLMPNCPLRNAQDIKDSYTIMKKTKANTLMSVIDYYWLYPFWALQEKNGSLDFFNKKYLVDSKDLPKNIYCPTGAVRWVRVGNFLRERKFYGKNLKKYEIPFERGADIDTYKDLELAKKFYKIVHESK